MWIVQLRSSPAAIAFYVIVMIIYVVIRFIIKANNKNNETLKQRHSRKQNFQQPQPNPFPQQQTDNPPVTEQFNPKDGIQQFMDMRSASTVNTTGSSAVYCMYCGKRFTNVDLLQRDTCFRHPRSEQGLQKHVLYRGPGKPNVGF